MGAALPTLRTARLTVRAISLADAPGLFEIFSDPEVTRYWSSPPLPDPTAARALAEEIEAGFRAGTLLQWGITPAGEHRLVGTCTLAAISAEHRRAELGFAVARREWGRGIATEAVPAVLRFAFGQLGLHRVEADADPRNLPSIRVLERLGFVREGLLRERYHQSGEVQDAVVFGLLRREWREDGPDDGRAPRDGSRSAREGQPTTGAGISASAPGAPAAREPSAAGGPAAPGTPRPPR